MNLSHDKSEILTIQRVLVVLHACFLIDSSQALEITRLSLLNVLLIPAFDSTILPGLRFFELTLK